LSRCEARCVTMPARAESAMTADYGEKQRCVGDASCVIPPPGEMTGHAGTQVLPRAGGRNGRAQCGIDGRRAPRPSAMAQDDQRRAAVGVAGAETRRGRWW